MAEALRVSVRTRLDADQARREARRMALALGFDRADAESVALAASELAMNLYRYATDGEIVLRQIEDDITNDVKGDGAPGGEAVIGRGGRGPGGGRRGIEIESVDAGPGIADPELALQDGYSTGGGLGSGLPAARRLMDELALTTQPTGTRIVARKWLHTR